MSSEKGFTKTDMDRVGIFQEMGYISIGDKYKTTKVEFNESSSKQKQMLSGAEKIKSANQAGYFSDKFQRVLEGEAYSDQAKMRRQYRLKESQKNVGKPFVPSSVDKKPSGAGSYYGTFSGPIPALSTQQQAGKGYKAPGKNFYTSPGKKGTGYGYAGVTLGHYTEYKSDNYDQYRELTRKENELHKKSLKGGAFRLNMAPKDYFDDNPYKSDRAISSGKKLQEKKWEIKPFKPSSPAKLDGGMKAGTFESYPSHSNDSYKSKAKDSRQASGASVKSGKTFIPPAGPKSVPVNSVLDQNIMRALNVQNYRTVQGVLSY